MPAADTAVNSIRLQRSAEQAEGSLCRHHVAVGARAAFCPRHFSSYERLLLKGTLASCSSFLCAHLDLPKYLELAIPHMNCVFFCNVGSCQPGGCGLPTRPQWQPTRAEVVGKFAYAAYARVVLFRKCLRGYSPGSFF